MPNPTLPAALTEVEIAEARELIAGLPNDSRDDAPWKPRTGVGMHNWEVVDGHGHLVASCPSTLHYRPYFIAASRTLVPLLLDEVERLRAREVEATQIAHDQIYLAASHEKLRAEVCTLRNACVARDEEVERLRSTQNALDVWHAQHGKAAEVADERNSLRAEVERMRPVYEAAKRVRTSLPADAVELRERSFHPATVDLVDAVDRAIGSESTPYRGAP